MRRLTTYGEARDAFRRKELRQALYDEGEALMGGVIVNLHGPDHLARRRLENRLFRRDTFAWYEAEVIPEIVGQVLAPALRSGRGDLLPLARRTMLTLALGVAGVDRRSAVGPEADVELDALYELMDRLARASTVAHATGDKAAIVADGDAALSEFVGGYFEPSSQRRAALVAAHDRGELDESELPRDVLTTLIRNQDRLELPLEVVQREIAYFPWVGSHSTSNQFVHAMHHVFEWLAEQPEVERTDAREGLAEDPVRLQQFVHESLRLHPASPVSLRHVLEPVTLRSGIVLEPGELVAIDLVAANRDPEVFGADADSFLAGRPLPEGVAPWGLSFGHGVHACLGQELAGGLEPVPGDELSGHLLGSITVMARAMLDAGARPDPERPAERDMATTREVFASYPVVFDG